MLTEKRIRKKFEQIKEKSVSLNDEQLGKEGSWYDGYYQALKWILEEE